MIDVSGNENGKRDEDNNDDVVEYLNNFGEVRLAYRWEVYCQGKRLTVNWDGVDLKKLFPEFYECKGWC